MANSDKLFTAKLVILIGTLKERAEHQLKCGIASNVDQYDIAIVGGGMVGIALACAMYNIHCIGQLGNRFTQQFRPVWSHNIVVDSLYNGDNLLQQSITLMHVKDPLFKIMGASRISRFVVDGMCCFCPLTWDIRMQIAVGTAKGLAYLHEGLEPKVVHRDVKSSNILLDKNWNPKVSDFGLAKLLGLDASYVTTRVMGTFGCVEPDYASTGMLNEVSDVYSFGVLLMELLLGRTPVYFARPAGEVNLVEWFRSLVASRQGEEVVDPRIEIQPAPRALKRLQLIFLRCIDLDASKRPKMGQVIHMLEDKEFPYRSENRLASQHDAISPSNRASPTDIARIALAPVETAER
ncbi:hypothetical protein MKW98_011009 [Papaver atlanticum]|uniref:non-specific serine/threonine protein kinase n=1 Tax=Papaver atlanticum TaxID=357466 RepID=A0AAD4TFI8_9MAGN|nr:hypothetical protein MKW98_011009 [Papaver atlanticum]